MEQLKEDFTKIMIWANKWRLKISILKTEFCVFSLINQVLGDARLYTMKLKGQVIKYNLNPKLLGVTLDEKLKYDVQTEQVERKALRSLDLLRRVKRTKVVNSKCMIQLYKAIITPQLEYAAAVWQIGDTSSLEKIQRN